MCLEVVTNRRQKPSATGTGFKCMIWDKDENLWIAQCWGEPAKTGVERTAKLQKRSLMRGEYWTGFHIFKSVRAVIVIPDFHAFAIVKVEWRHLLAEGTYSFTYDGRVRKYKAVVAKYMTIIGKAR